MYKIQISIKTQRLLLFKNNNPIKSYPISTAENGVGEQMGSYQTPRGKHYIRAKIGQNAPLGMTFVARRATGKICPSLPSPNTTKKDYITSRILWLCGLEKGKNRGGKVDSFRRFIYIHGTPDWEPMGIPKSHGCVRMRNTDIVELFELIPVYTPVTIFE